MLKNMEFSGDNITDHIMKNNDMISKPSMWLVGGDGWA